MMMYCTVLSMQNWELCALVRRHPLNIHRLVSVKLNLLFVINSKLCLERMQPFAINIRKRETLMTRMCTMCTMCVWERKRYKNVTFCGTVFVYLKFNLNAFFPILSSPFHLLSFPIHSSFDFIMRVAAICHSFSFIEFNFMLQCCSFLQYFFLCHFIALCVSCIFQTVDDNFFIISIYIPGWGKNKLNAYIARQSLSTFIPFPWYGNQIIYFHQQIFFNAVKLIHLNIYSFFFSLFHFKLHTIYNLWVAFSHFL